MKLEGSCACDAVSFEVESVHPYPFNLCYCSICRKTAGGGGFAINLGGDAATLQVTGREHSKIYQAAVPSEDGTTTVLSPAERHFCGICSSALWVWDSRWPELLHPFASAIDSDLPVPPERTHLMLGSKAAWIEPAIGVVDKQFAEYPEESIAEWHARVSPERGQRLREFDVAIEKWTAAEMDASLPDESTQGRRYVEPFQHGSMRLGYYAPRGHDPQQPHTQDELYFVERGTGTFTCGSEQTLFKPGDAFFVRAGETHRFESFSGDFAAWVVFWGAEGGE